MDEWIPLFALPNLWILEPIECAGLAAVVPASDGRIRALRKAHPKFDTFLSQFTDEFGTHVAPAVMLIASTTPESYRTVEATASFRDLISVCAIPEARARNIKYYVQGAFFSDTFSLYPWMLDVTNEQLIIRTPTASGVRDDEGFCGHTSPGIPYKGIQENDLDLLLLQALSKRWRVRYSEKPTRWRDRALFRALNMANQAAQSPSGTDTTYYDVGRSIALWISAFEILAHPRVSDSNLRVVCALLEETVWLHRELTLRRFKTYESRNRSSRRILACSIYGELYRVRNDFLHGNRVRPARLRFRRTDYPLAGYAACLFRLALTSFLKLSHIPPKNTNIKSRAGWIAASRYMRSLQAQRVIEEALLTAAGDGRALVPLR